MTTPSALDPRAPLVLDTSELGRRPGTQRLRSLEAPAPADLGIEVIGVPEGSPIGLELRLEAVMEGVLVTGTATVQLEGECARCVTEIDDEIEVDFVELYVYERDARRAGDEEDDTLEMVGDLLDLEPLLRDAVVLQLPFQPLCEPDCPGLCAECGVRLADEPEHDHGEPVDIRLAGLADLRTRLAEGS